MEIKKTEIRSKRSHRSRRYHRRYYYSTRSQIIDLLKGFDLTTKKVREIRRVFISLANSDKAWTKLEEVVKRQQALKEAVNQYEQTIKSLGVNTKKENK